ncbi:MAG: pyruvate kinase [Candidatus Neomarinimicrobiota bacterium]
MDIKTKIIATVGPSCFSKEKIESLIKSGVTCFRVNLSHGTKSEKSKCFDLLRSCRLRSGIRPTILADLAGPKIRVSRRKEPIRVQKGQQVYISSEKTGKNVVPISEGIKFQTVEKGAKILIDDGKILLEVEKLISNKTLLCKAEFDGVVEQRKGINFPGIELDLPSITDQDEKDLELALSKGADWVALSFVRSSSDYQILRDIIIKLGFTTPILAKIEKWEAVKNMNDIIDTFDAVMVARGDLGVELPLEQVPGIQKKVIKKAIKAGKPVVLATQILDSMIKRPVPTRAEVSDIANAILDGADALMVTGETAVGKHPVKVIKVLSRVIAESENSINYKTFIKDISKKKLNTAQSISHAACSVAVKQGIKKIITMTHSGSTARMVSRYRPSAKIIAMTPFKETCRQLGIVWGVQPLLVKNYNTSDDIPLIANEMLILNKDLRKNEKYVITGGVPVGVPGTTNYLSVLEGV